MYYKNDLCFMAILVHKIGLMGRAISRGNITNQTPFKHANAEIWTELDDVGAQVLITI